MPNMSYCRFENTYNDLQDCLTAIEELTESYADGEPDPLSRHEESYRLDIYNLCKSYMEACEELEEVQMDYKRSQKVA